MQREREREREREEGITVLWTSRYMHFHGLLIKPLFVKWDVEIVVGRREVWREEEV